MLKIIRIALIAALAAALAAAVGLYIYHYNHDDVSPPVFRSAFSENDVLEVSVDATREELCLGLRAFDNIDGEITDRILIKSISRIIEGSTVRVTYVVFDDASNYATYSRLVRYTDYHAPRFGLKKAMLFHIGDTITFLDRVTATDARDGDISGRIILSETTVNSSAQGTYRAVVSVTNRMGDTAELPLTVMVINKSASMPTIGLSSYLVYLPRNGELDAAEYLSSVNDPLAREEIPLSSVKINDSLLNSSEPGVYEIYYYYTGQSGEVATVILTVVVE